MSRRRKTSGWSVSTSTVVRDGFTTPPDACSWAITRAIGAADVTRIGQGSPASRLLVSHPGVQDGLHGTAAAIEALLATDLPGPQVLSVVGDLMSHGVLLAPLVGMKRGWRYDMVADHLSGWVERLEAEVGGARLPHKGRRMLANLWLCTLEGRVPHPDRTVVQRFLGTLVNKSGKGRWLQGMTDAAIEGAKAAAVAFGVEHVSRKYSQLSEILSEAKKASDISEWSGLHDRFVEAKHLGSVTKYEIGFKHFIVYLTEHPHIAKIEAFFSRGVERPSLAEWMTARGTSPSHRHSMLAGLVAFFEWVVAGDDRLSAADEYGEARVARPGIMIPIQQSDVDRAQSAKQVKAEDPSETVHFALVAEHLEEVTRILFDDDMAWPKKRLVDWIEWTNPVSGKVESVYCPVLPNLIGLLINLPIRHVQARRLDSGEGDAEAFDTETGTWVPNYGSHARYWKSRGVAQPQRGALRRIDDTIAKRTLCGIFINSNKTADRRTLFDERSGYVIEWHNLIVIDIIQRMRRWQEAYNPVDGPTKYTQVRPGVFEKMAKGVAGRRPDCFYLFRYPAGNSRDFRTSPPSSQQLRMFWYEVLAELETRLKRANPDAPAFISTWLGHSPQSSPYTLHGLRHGGLTKLAMAGVHPWILQNIVAGHAAWIMTLYYIRPNAAHISEALTEAYVKAMRDRQNEMKNFLATRTLEEAHRVAVGSEDAFRSLQSLRDSSLPNIVGHLASLDHGICPNGRTRCSEGCSIMDLTERKPRELRNAYGPVPVTVGGAPDCTRCRFFLTGTPFMEGMRLKTNEVSLAASKSAERYHALRRDVDAREAARAQAVKDGLDRDIREEHALHIARQELKAEAEILADLGLSLDAHAKKWQQVRALARFQKEAGEAAVPALLFEQPPEFEWDLQPRFEAVDELCFAARWFPSLRTAELNRERREKVLRLLVRNRKPPALALMTEEEADIAAGAVISLLYKRFGQTATRKLFDDQETFETLGLVDGVEEVMAHAIGKPITMQLEGKPPQKMLGGTARALPDRRKARPRGTVLGGAG